MKLEENCYTEAIAVPNGTERSSRWDQIVVGLTCQTQGAWASCIKLISLSGYLCSVGHDGMSGGCRRTFSIPENPG